MTSLWISRFQLETCEAPAHRMRLTGTRRSRGLAETTATGARLSAARIVATNGTMNGAGRLREETRHA